MVMETTSQNVAPGRKKRKKDFYEGVKEIEERYEIGKVIRDKVPRESHGIWEPPSGRKDPVDILIESNEGRIPQLVPIRHGRMSQSPFTYLRGAAAGMAYDLSFTPVTGAYVQACGDCHLSNFGLFATPERNIIFDINDFDETTPGPWEWDLKRLVASIYVAMFNIGMNEKDAYALARLCCQEYRETVRRLSLLSNLDVWYTKVDPDSLMNITDDIGAKKAILDAKEQARRNVGEYITPKLTRVEGGRRKIVDSPPLVYHLPEGSNGKWNALIAELLAKYKETVSQHLKVLLDLYELEDFAMKVVGVGSVGTYCAVLLMRAGSNDWLILQVKEAKKSVLEPYVGKSKFRNHGQRVVEGQKIMQSASDPFLGWVSVYGHDYYIRQLKDMKWGVSIDKVPKFEIASVYIRACGASLAKAHARDGDQAIIAGYMGKGKTFDIAIADFAKAYHQQTVSDHNVMLEAIRSGKIEAQKDMK
jgi:uncharacterized protein (DUF2252 family)